MMNKNLVLLSYGKKSEYLRALGCISSFFAWIGSDHRKIRLIIYTDNPDFFKSSLDYPGIEYLLLTDNKLTEFKGTQNFVHRIKVAVIGETYRNYPDEEVVFIDSDTFFIGDPKEIVDKFEPGVSFMHKREYNFKEGLALFNSFNQGQYPEKFIQYISDREFSVGGIPETFTSDDYSWNSGVIGLQKDFGRYMDDVLTLTDEFYTHSQWFISEQLAFSLVLQRTTQIRPAENFVCHYWGTRQKVLVDKLLEDFFVSLPISKLSNKALIREITLVWRRKIEADMLLEQAEIAFSQGSFKYSTKKYVQFILLKMLRLQFTTGKLSLLR